MGENPGEQLKGFCEVVDELYRQLRAIKPRRQWADVLTAMAALQEVSYGLLRVHGGDLLTPQGKKDIDPEEWRRMAPVWREAAEIVRAAADEREHEVAPELAAGPVGTCLQALAAAADRLDTRTRALDELTETVLRAA